MIQFVRTELLGEKLVPLRFYAPQTSERLDQDGKEASALTGRLHNMQNKISVAKSQ
jgi:hypothetical protein